MKKSPIKSWSGLVLAVMLRVCLFGSQNASAQGPAAPAAIHTWRAINNGLPDNFPSSPLVVLASPVDSNTVYAGFNTAGVYRTVNAGLNWSPVNTGLPDGPSIDMLASSPDGSVLYARNASYVGGGLFRASPGNMHWTLLDKAPTYDTIFSLYVDATSVYIGTYSMGIYRSTTAGDSWTHIDGSPYPGGWNTIAGTPQNSKLLYAGISAVYKTIDGGDNWTTMPSLGCPGGGTYIMDVKIDPAKATTVVVGDDGECIARSTDGKTWTPVYTSQGAKQILFDPADSSQVYAIAISFLDHYGSVLKSINNGQTWAGFNDGLPFGTVISLSIGRGGREKPSAVYAALTTSGIYTTRPPMYFTYLPIAQR